MRHGPTCWSRSSIPPPNNCFTNTLKKNRHRNPFYKALFAALKEIDPFVAGTVTLSISY